jgi:hypothetical protein
MFGGWLSAGIYLIVYVAGENGVATDLSSILTDQMNVLDYAQSGWS